MHCNLYLEVNLHLYSLKTFSDICFPKFICYTFYLFIPHLSNTDVHIRISWASGFKLDPFLTHESWGKGPCSRCGEYEWSWKRLTHSLNSGSLWLSIRVTWWGRREEVASRFGKLGHVPTCTDTSYKSSGFWDFFLTGKTTAWAQASYMGGKRPERLAWNAPQDWLREEGGGL